VSRAVLKEATKLCLREQDRLLIVRVIPPKPADDLNRHRAIVAASNDDLRALISEFAFVGSWNNQEIEGEPRSVIVETAASVDADYLVLGLIKKK
jgi:hypothetical protein